MKEFRSHVILEMHKAGLGRINLKDLYSRCCIVSLTLVKSSMDIMETPCWINIINLGALRMLRDENGRSLVNMTAIHQNIYSNFLSVNYFNL